MRLRTFVPALILLGMPAYAAASGFIDIPANAWYASYVQQATDLGLVAGYRDAKGSLTGQFGPVDNVSIAQALKIAVVSAGHVPQHEFVGGQPCTPRDHWACMYSWEAGAADLPPAFWTISEYDRPARRAEVATLFAIIFNVLPRTGSGLTSPFRDVAVDTEDGMAIARLARDGVVTGDADSTGQPTGLFRPNDPINRAEVVKIALKAREVYGARPIPHIDSTCDPSLRDNLVFYTGDVRGFMGVDRVPVGTTVTFCNVGSGSLRVATMEDSTHPSPASFHSPNPVPFGQTFSYTFEEPGTWTYHDSLSPYDTTSTITVTP